MLQQLINHLNNYKIIGIFGYGQDGQAFYEFAKQNLEDTKLVIIDQKNGEDYLEALYKVDLIVKSPGISLHNLSISYDDFNFTSTTELFLKFFSNITIGVTGTKGKSTLCTVIYNMLQNDNQKSFLCGNIGIPVFETINQIDEKSQVIMELSSHQLENLTQSPHIAILLNLFPEHLDYYKNCDKYYEAKYNIFKYQSKDDIAIVNFENIPKKLNDNIVTPKLYNVYTNQLKYKHNFDITKGYIHHTSLQVLEKYVELVQMPQEVYIYTINQFHTLHHRLEYVGEYNGAMFINDSISTIPQTTIEAIKILDDVNIVIIGGYDRGVDYSILVNFLKTNEIKYIILCSQTGKLIYDLIDEKSNVYYKENLKEATLLAKELINTKEICLFSPGASSFDEFANFEERGDYFKKIVQSVLPSSDL